MNTKEKLLERIDREYRRMLRHQLEIENNRRSIAKAKRLLKDLYDYDYDQIQKQAF
jgi:hypothetical protein